MSCFAHYASRHAAEAEFQLVQARYVVGPALLWAVATVLVVATTTLHGAPVSLSAQTPMTEASTIAPHGA
jgi:hypothetical protein